MAEEKDAKPTSNERPTTTIETPGGHKVVIKTYLTGREARKYRRPYYRMARVNKGSVESGKFDLEFLDDIPPEIIEESEDLLIEVAVVSIDGHTDNIVDRVLSLKEPDYNAVADRLNKISKGLPGGKGKK